MKLLRAIAALSMLVLLRLTAQISPGELSDAHKDLEGMGNCTNCHTIGKALSNDNCLQCHTEIGERVSRKKGFHASVAGKHCVECHKEHHGRSFAIVRFDRGSFDHTSTGYALEGKHASAACDRCHRAERLTGDAARFSAQRKKRTFLGLSVACLTCHKDEHRGQLNKDCRACHDMNGWKPAPAFSHARTRFALSGAHGRVDCIRCHPRSEAGGTAMKFAGLSFSSCRDCHQDPHKGRFTKPCEACHSVDSWRSVSGSAFDHRSTKFPLVGRHAELRCERCHPKDPKAKNPNGTTGFHLTRFAECRDCHADAHAAQFDRRKGKGECRECHTEEGFRPARFTAADHGTARFPLTGAHQAVPCAACHRDGAVRSACTKRFTWTGTLRCTDCHDDVHRGQFNGRMKEGCVACHTVDAWESLTFTHDRTGFPLIGRHAAVKCSSCHPPQDGFVRYAGTDRRCDQCHKDVHAGQFESGGRTACERCHDERAWKAVRFDHGTHARFALTGKHESVRCVQCHPVTLIRGVRTVKYKPLESACIDCHPAQ